MVNILELCVSIDNNYILKGVNININPGEIHVIMGPNGSGKSTLAEVLMGRQDIHTKGKVIFNQGLENNKNIDLLSLSAEFRSKLGIFLAFQNPPEIDGLSLTNLIKASLDSQRDFAKLGKINSKDFLDLLYKYGKMLKLDKQFLSRSIGVGMSGGEKKRCEMLQMAMLDPKFVILDEIDSGVDVDSLKIILSAINKSRSVSRSWLIITHYANFTRMLKPDFIHILIDGKIVCTSNLDVLKKLECGGFDQFR